MSYMKKQVNSEITISGSLDVYADLDAPALQSVGGYLYVYADLDAPALQTVGGSLYVSADLDAPVLQSVGGYLYASADLDAPTLEKINGLKVKDIKYINRENFIKLTGACSEGVDDFITRTGHESLPIAKLSRILTKEHLHGAKTIAWIIKQQNILKGRK